MNESEHPRLETDPANSAETESRVLPKGLQITAELANSMSESDLDGIYDSYAKAMSRRDRAPLAPVRFRRHFFEGGSLDSTCAYGDANRGFLLGLWKHEIFIPIHFAPKTLRGGYELFRELAKSAEIPVVTAVTEDIAATLKKMDGWKTRNISLLSYFSSDLVKKTLVYNSCPGIWRKMGVLVKEFIAETREMGRQRESAPSSEESNQLSEHSGEGGQKSSAPNYESPNPDWRCG